MEKLRSPWQRAVIPAVTLVGLGLVVLLSACGLAGREPTQPAPTPTGAAPTTSAASPSPAPPVTETPTPREGPAAFGPGDPTPVPILYKMFDYGSDFQKTKPEWGPVGSIHWNLWRDVNPGRGAYNWNAIDKNLALEAPLKVTLST